MESGWLGPVLGLAGVLLGVTGTLIVQQFGFRRADTAVRHELAVLLLLALEQFAYAGNPWASGPSLWLPGIRERFNIAIRRGREPDVASALTNHQHLVVRRAVESLQELFHVIESLVRDDIAFNGVLEAIPSSNEYIKIQAESKLRVLTTTLLVSRALFCLGERDSVRRALPSDVWQMVEREQQPKRLHFKTLLKRGLKLMVKR